MVAPLHIHAVVIHQAVHDDIGVRSPVIHIAYQVQPRYSQPLDQRAEGADQVLRFAHIDRGLQDACQILGPVLPILAGDQLLQHIAVLIGQSGAQLGA